MESTSSPQRISPWPIFVAFGLAFSEVGVFVGILPIAVAGLLLFSGSVAGILDESGYVDGPWRTLLVMGALLVLVGVGLYAYTGAPMTLATIVETLRVGETVAYRGVVVAIAGLLTLGLAGTAKVVSKRPDSMP